MLTLSLDDVIKDPTDVLASILGFVWREDWEWEGSGGGKHPQGGLLPQQRGWKQEAEDLVENHGGSLQKLLEQTSLILQETTSSARGNNSFQKAIQGSFASEMKRSADMTAWPCPSFWEGVETGGGGGDGNDQMLALQRLSEEMVPRCSDDNPFVRCTVNKDRCEVKKDAKCK